MDRGRNPLAKPERACVEQHAGACQPAPPPDVDRICNEVAASGRDAARLPAAPSDADWPAHPCRCGARFGGMTISIARAAPAGSFQQCPAAGLLRPRNVMSSRQVRGVTGAATKLARRILDVAGAPPAFGG